MALELEVLILIPNDSHLADEANKNHIICKKVRWDSEATKVEAFCHMAMPRKPVHKNYKASQWQRVALVESNMHQEWVRLIAGNANKARAMIIEG